MRTSGSSIYVKTNDYWAIFQSTTRKRGGIEPNGNRSSGIAIVVALGYAVLRGGDDTTTPLEGTAEGSSNLGIPIPLRLGTT
jgi:hypothetical protein